MDEGDRDIGSSKNRDIGKVPNLTTEARRHRENQKIQMMSVGNFGIVGNSCSIGVRA
jgi:hypothetical protein